jgi:hypothetical protein
MAINDAILDTALFVAVEEDVAVDMLRSRE